MAVVLSRFCSTDCHRVRSAPFCKWRQTASRWFRQIGMEPEPRARHRRLHPLLGHQSRGVHETPRPWRRTWSFTRSPAFPTGPTTSSSAPSMAPGCTAATRTEVSAVISSAVASPTISAVSPGVGPTAGGTDVVISGHGLPGRAQVVRFGATPAARAAADGEVTDGAHPRWRGRHRLGERDQPRWRHRHASRRPSAYQAPPDHHQPDADGRADGGWHRRGDHGDRLPGRRSGALRRDARQRAAGERRRRSRRGHRLARLAPCL